LVLSGAACGCTLGLAASCCGLAAFTGVLFTGITSVMGDCVLPINGASAELLVKMLHRQMKSSKHPVKLFCLKMVFIEFLILFFSYFCVKTFRYIRL